MDILGRASEQVQLYLIRCDGNISGMTVFTLSPFVKPGCDYCIVDIFVLNNYRGRGIASSVCRLLFKEHPGRYCIEVAENDNVALEYWDNLIAKEGHLIERIKNKESLIVYEFEITKGLISC